MRLLNVSTLSLSEFVDGSVPKYAILSHRWGTAEQEVSLQDYTQGQKRATSGYRKILQSCEFTRSRNLDWIWIDTCCIDKTSSAELSEAINSMFKWYADSTECYAYLEDVTLELESTELPGTFSRSQWFTRGWTLQELLAPDQVIFCDQSWDILGTKVDLARTITHITGIDESFLLHRSRITQASIAMRMSWASRRETTRSEDIAYSLLGLFDLSLPLLYGEGGSKAFVRLQLALIAKSDDESIFAWTSQELSSWGMLAPSPKSFSDAGRIVNLEVMPEERLPYRMTNKGLELYLRHDKQYINKPLAQSQPLGFAQTTMALACFRAEAGGLVFKDLKYQVVNDLVKAGKIKMLSIDLARRGAKWDRVCCNRLGEEEHIVKPRGFHIGSTSQVHHLYLVRQPGI